MARQAAEDVRRGALPQTAEAYKIELPADFKAPEGVEYKFIDNDPLLAQAKGMAKEMGLSQDQFSKLLGLYAGSQVSTQGQIQAARNAEIAKLGPTGPARIDAVTAYYKATLGDEGAKQMMARVFTASDVALHEKLITRAASQGGGSFTRAGVEPAGQPGRLSDADYAKLSASQKYDYALRHDQSQFRRAN